MPDIRDIRALSWIRHWNMSSKHYVRGCQQQKWTLKPCEANKVSKTAIVISSNLLQDCSSFFPFVFAMLFIPSFRVLSSFFMFHPVWWWFQLFEIWLITWHSSFNSLIRHCVCHPNNHCFSNTPRRTEFSQEHLKTTTYAIYGGQRECIIRDSKNSQYVAGCSPKLHTITRAYNVSLFQAPR